MKDKVELLLGKLASFGADNLNSEELHTYQQYLRHASELVDEYTSSRYKNQQEKVGVLGAPNRNKEEGDEWRRRSLMRQMRNDHNLRESRLSNAIGMLLDYTDEVKNPIPTDKRKEFARLLLNLTDELANAGVLLPEDFYPKVKVAAGLATERTL